MAGRPLRRERRARQNAGAKSRWIPDTKPPFSGAELRFFQVSFTDEDGIRVDDIYVADWTKVGALRKAYSWSREKDFLLNEISEDEYTRALDRLHASGQLHSLDTTGKNNPRPPTYTTAKPATVRLAKMVGEACRLDETVALPTDNFWYAWLLAALARGVVRNETHDKYTASLADMTLRQIAAMADSDVSFYDT